MTHLQPDPSLRFLLLHLPSPTTIFLGFPAVVSPSPILAARVRLVSPAAVALPKNTSFTPQFSRMRAKIAPKELCWKTKRKLKINSRYGYGCTDINTERILQPTQVLAWRGRGSGGAPSLTLRTCALDSGPARGPETVASAGICTWSPTPYCTGGTIVREACILPGRSWWKMPLTDISKSHASSELACVPVPT